MPDMWIQVGHLDTVSIVWVSILCCLVMEMYNDKVVDAGDDIMVDSVMTTVSEPISIPPIKDITKDDNFVDVSFIVCILYVYICVCVRTCLCLQVCVCLHACACACVCVCLFLSLSACVCLSVQVCVCVFADNVICCVN